MRKWLAMLSALSLLTSMAACGKASTVSSPEGGATSAGTTTTSDGYVVESDGGFREIIDTEDVVITETTKSKEEFLAQRKITIIGTPDDLNGWVYQLGVGGIRVREAVIDSGRGGETVEIVQISDLHYNKVNNRDLEEKNPSVMSTYEQRDFLSGGSSLANAEVCLRYASFFDQMVLTGDTLDYVSWGSLELLKESVWDKYPEALVALGNHDSVRVMGLPNDVKDPTTRESRYALLQQHWRHDVYYTAKVVKNKVMVIQLDNSQNGFWDSQVPKLAADIETAREKGYTVLLFMHTPLNTANPAETCVQPISLRSKGGCDFYTGCVGGEKSRGATREVWDLIMNNADVIRGVFAGHMHADYYTEMCAKTPSGEDRNIPQYVLSSAAYDKGYALKITVK